MFQVLDVHIPAKSDPTAWRLQADYRRCESIEELREYVEPSLARTVPVFADWETTSLNLYKFKDYPAAPAFFLEPAKPVGFSISVRPGTARYVPINHGPKAECNLPASDVVEVLKELDAAGTTTGWFNYKYDGEFMHQAFGWTPSRWLDVMTAVWLQDSSGRQFGLKPSADRLLHLKMIDFVDIMGEAKNFAELDPDAVLPYVCADADIPGRLYRLPQVQAALRGQAFIHQLENLVSPVLREGMRDGVYLDRAVLLDLQRDCHALLHGGMWRGEPVEGVVTELRRLVARIKQWSRQTFDFTEAQVARDFVRWKKGAHATTAVRATLARQLPEAVTFNLESSQQVGKFLIAMGAPIAERTDTGQVATGKEILEKYARLALEGGFPMPTAARRALLAVVQYRELMTQKEDYVDKLLAAVDYFGPRVHFPFHHVGVPTGRMKAGGEDQSGKKRKPGQLPEAYSKGFVDLNVQSIPKPDKRKPYLPLIRSAFVPNPPFSDDFVWVSIDFSQIELRVCANLSREPQWIQAFQQGVDIHARNAQLAYSDPAIGEDDPRRAAGKTMSFAVLFGASDATVADHGNISISAAKAMRANYFSNARVLGSWIESTQVAAYADRRVQTPFGRIRPLPQFHPDNPRGVIEEGKRLAVNTRIQGGAADYFKIALTKVRALIKERGWQQDAQQVLWVHDEVDLRVRRSLVETIVPAVQQAMEFPVRGWPVPIRSKVEVGENWQDLVPYATWIAQQSSTALAS